MFKKNLLITITLILLLVSVIFLLYKFSTAKLSLQASTNLMSSNQEILKPGIYSQFIQSDNLDTRYKLYLPNAYKKESHLPLVILLHSEEQNSDEFTKSNKFIDLSSSKNFILISPDKTGDSKFISKLIDMSKTDLNVDNWKIYLVGFSSGGIDALKISCEISDKISSLAIIGASFLKDDLRLCQNPSPISIAIFNGTNDKVIPYEGGRIDSTLLNGEVVGNDITLNFWINNNKSRTDPIEEISKADINGEFLEKESYYGNSNVIMYKMNGGGHSWNSNVSDLIWSFFDDSIYN